MKTLLSMFVLLFVVFQSMANYVIHAPDGVYVSVALKLLADEYSTSFAYGANSDESDVYDGWYSRPPNTWPGLFETEGNDLMIRGDWIPGWDGSWECPTCNVWVGGPPPDFMGGGESSIGSAGEYWIDFASDGTARISTTQPSDFGKWAWDGSINPSWVETLVVKRGKSHKK